MSTKGNKPSPQKPVGVRKTAHGAKSDAIRDKAILALLSEKTLQTAAQRCGVNERTLRRWMADDATFKSELDEARRAAFQAGMNRVQALTGEAVETLAALMAPDVSPAVRLGAARTVAELGIHQHDAQTITSKLDELEAYQRQRENEGR